jgi:arylsulfatase/uncharacterized sulfatase
MVMLRQMAAGALTALALGDWTPACAQVGDTRSNIVVILVDDAALMDFGAFGGEARTPNIDQLARQGVMFSAYHTSPLCSPSRAMLLTGIDNHRTGVSTIEEVLPPEQRGKHGYTLHLEPGVLTIADRLRAAGYRTLMAGKWHLGHGAGDLPNAHGFDRSLALDASGADNWEQKPYMPYYDHAAWFEDGKPTRLPANFYSSDLLVDRLISYIDESPSRTRPYFAYLPFQAVHIPVQAPKAFSDHYKGQFLRGRYHGFGIISLAATLGIAVTAEGVERVDEATLLDQMGCPSAQGFLYSPALPAEQITPLLDHRYLVPAG